MSWGLDNRLSRIIRPEDHRTVMLAVDHGYFLGPTTGLEVPCESVMPIAPFADTLMLTRGMLRTSIDSSLATPIVLRVSGANSVLDDDLSNETIITSIEECIRDIESLDKHVHPVRGSTRREILRILRAVQDRREDVKNWRDNKPCFSEFEPRCDGCEKETP